MIELTKDPIDLTAVHAAVLDPTCGGVCCFVGTTRDHHEGRPVAELGYEAYEPMALKELHKLAEELRSRYAGVQKVAIIHRLGRVPLTEASVVIAVAAPHRDEAFEACRFGIDELKARIPIWKKESYRDGTEPRWVANRESETSEVPR